jgi:putative lipoprotein
MLPTLKSRRRSLLLATLLVSAICPRPAAAEPLFGSDKALHFGVSLGLGGGIYTTLSLIGDDARSTRLLLSIPMAVSAGLAKEIYDAGQPHNAFSGADLLWDVVGAATGALLAWLIDRLLFSRSPPPAPASPASVSSGGSGYCGQAAPRLAIDHLLAFG